MYIMNTEEFIKCSKVVHGDRFIYDKSEYINPTTKIVITCRKHGDFATKPYNHMNGSGCRKCADEANSLAFRKSKEQFVKEAMEVHGNKYDYSKVDYVNWKTKVTIICPKHGDFEQTPNAHLSGEGCPECWKERFAKMPKFS